MLSRVAERLYWMSRYLERADNTARLINSITQVLLDLPLGVKFGWDILIKILGLDDLFLQHHSKANENNIVHFLIQEEKNPGSVVSCIRFARENSRTLREILPTEFWERVNGLYLYIQKNASGARHGRSQRYEILSQVVERRQSLVGLVTNSMSRDIAYQFIKLGQNLERADMMTRTVDVNSEVLLPEDPIIAVPTQERLWMATLTAISAYQMYRRQVGVHVYGKEAAHFLLNDPHFPRTTSYCLGEIESCLAVLPDHEIPMKLTRSTYRRLELAPLGENNSVTLHEYLDQIQEDLGAIHEAISRQYFYLYQTGTNP
ncbi:putative alpha-E superfamily protein [Gammaproteobacteria bacterium]